MAHSLTGWVGGGRADFDDRSVQQGVLPLVHVQNLAVPFTLEIEPPPADIRERAVALAREVGLPEAVWTRPVAQLDGAGRLRVKLARALALDPAVVLLEHPTAAIAPDDVVPLGAQIRAIARRRGAAAVALTADRDFACAIATRVLMLEAATGRLSARRG